MNQFYHYTIYRLIYCTWNLKTMSHTVGVNVTSIWLECTRVIGTLHHILLRWRIHLHTYCILQCMHLPALSYQYISINLTASPYISPSKNNLAKSSSEEDRWIVLFINSMACAILPPVPQRWIHFVTTSNTSSLPLVMRRCLKTVVNDRVRDVTVSPIFTLPDEVFTSVGHNAWFNSMLRHV